MMLHGCTNNLDTHMSDMLVHIVDIRFFFMMDIVFKGY